MFRQIADNLWVTERPQRFFGVEIGTRMTIIRLDGGALFVHSPVHLDAQTRGHLDELGPVRFVIAPNRMHHLYVGEYFDAYPQATIYAAPGLPQKRSDLKFHGVLGEGPPAGWAGQIDQLHFPAEPMLNEIVFCHRASG